MRCCGGVNIIIIRSQPSRRECNAETTDDEDGDVDVDGGVDGDDVEVVYYYYCDYYSQARTIGTQGQEPRGKAALQHGKNQAEAHVDVVGLAAAASMKDQRCQGATMDLGVEDDLG